MIARPRGAIGNLSDQLRKIPIWIYVVLLILGVVVLAQSIRHEMDVRRSSTVFRRDVYRQLAKASADFSYDVRMKAWTDSGERPLQPDEPLSISDSSGVDVTTVQYDGVCAKSGSIRTIEIEFHAPAFTVEPLDKESRSFQVMRRPYCELSKSIPNELKWSWVIVPKQVGHHVITLRFVARDAKGREVAPDRIVEIPTIVHQPASVQVVAGFLSSFTGLIGMLGGLSDRLRGASSVKES